MPCRYRHEGGENLKGAFLPKEKCGSGERKRGESRWRGVGEEKEGGGRGGGESRTGEEMRARAPRRDGANQASCRHQF